MRAPSPFSWRRHRPSQPDDAQSLSSESSSIPYHAAPTTQLSTPIVSTRDPPSTPTRSLSQPSNSRLPISRMLRRPVQPDSADVTRHSTNSEVFPVQRLRAFEPYHPLSPPDSRRVSSAVTVTPPPSFDVASPPSPPPAPHAMQPWRKPPAFRRKHHANTQTTHPAAADPVFGVGEQKEDRRPREDGEQVLVKFLRSTLGPKAQGIAVRLVNKTPLPSQSAFSYVITQGSEDEDIDMLRAQLTSGRLVMAGMRYAATAWANLLLGDRFFVANNRQKHELVYRRATCTCIICKVRACERSRTVDQADLSGLRDHVSVVSVPKPLGRTPSHSAMANFVVRYSLPNKAALDGIGASSSFKELEIGTVVRLNYRASAKLKLTDDVKELLGHLAYTGPISHEDMYRKVTTIGVHYYLYNKGKTERKVYIQGELVRLPINVGIIKLGTQPMYMPELGATFCLHRKQIMSIYVGEIVLEGNSVGSFIKTGIHYYIGFGEERGVCPVYPNKTLGKARKLGINELLLHHHMVDDLEVKCI
eukprot:TRINITY_DN757_c0_g1_i1.p1 TRINITY_DN757_c0_g1~~TRINITY_DN757_c0_g1_i1.p1  ORF type:complete len:531 (-),score=78.98 TRINITY_DN757_c0_g1_i1:4303-5895(-)